MPSTPPFRCTDAALLRASTYPQTLTPQPYPIADDDWPIWIRRVWANTAVVEAVSVASPDLARTLTSLCTEKTTNTPREIRRAGQALLRYVLRWSSRATPFGLFAGIAPIRFGGTACLRRGTEHRAFERPTAEHLAVTVDRLHRQPEVLRGLQIQANNLGFRRRGDWVVPAEPAGRGPAEWVIADSPALRLALRETAQPVLFTRLVEVLQAEAPTVSTAVVEGMVTELVHLGVLLTSLTPPTTVTDPAAHLEHAVHARVDEPARRSVDLRVDSDLVLPPRALREAERAAALLVRLSPPRPTWRTYHRAFLDRYGLGAAVPVRDLVDPDLGLGYPISAPHTMTRRDVTLARLAQQAAVDGSDLDADTVLTALGEAELGPPVPHTELRFSLAAASLDALDRGDFTLAVLSAARAAGTTIGRFLYLLDPPDRTRFTAAYTALATSTPGARTVHLATPSTSPHLDNLTRVPAIWPLLPLGEFHTDTAVDIEMLLVTADINRLYLISRNGCPIEPVLPNAVNLRTRIHPLARFLCEMSTGLSSPCIPFSWGQIASTFSFLPRIRSGRILLSPARWNLTASDLPGPAAPEDVWTAALTTRAKALHLPRIVLVGDDDVRIRLDLAEPSHLGLLRAHLNRSGSAALTEDPRDDRWLHGQAHEIVLTLTTTTPPRPPARPLPTRPTPQIRHVPGASAWLYAKLWAAPDQQTGLLTRHLPQFLRTWQHGPSASAWFIRYDDPAPHLRLRARLHSPELYGPGAAELARWANQRMSEGLLRDITLETYRPETGRFGTGALLAAAEAVFAADSTAALTHLALLLHPTAATALGFITLATGLLDADGLPWLVEHLDHGKGPRLDRTIVEQARRASPLPADDDPRLHQALMAYRSLLDDNAIDTALADLLHLHHARMIGIDRDSEKLCLRLARATVQYRLHTGRQT